MADSRSVRAGGAFIEIFSDDTKLLENLERTTARIQKWAAATREIAVRSFEFGTALLGPILAATKVYSEMGTELAELSEKTGISVETLSKLKYAAGQTGTSFEALQMGVKTLSKLLHEAATGGAEAQATFRQLHLSVAELRGLSADEQFKRIADAMKGMTNESDRIAMAVTLFGKSGMAMLPMLKNGAAGIDELFGAAERLGVVISTDDALAAKEFTQRIRDLWEVVKVTAFAVGSQFAPVLRGVAMTMTGAVKVVKDFVTAHKDVVNVAAAVGVALLGVGAAAMVLSTVFSVIATPLELAAGALGVIFTVLGAIATPLGAMALGVAGVTAVLLKFTNTGQAVGKYLADVFSQLKTDATIALGGIVDALSAGDWQLAAKILWTALRLEFHAGINKLKVWWAELRFAMADTWADFASTFELVWSRVVETFKDSWNSMKTSATKFFTWLKDTWEASVNFVADAIQDAFMATAKKEMATNMARINAAEKAGRISPEQAEHLRATERESALTYDQSIRNPRDQQRKQDYKNKQAAIDAAYDAKDANNSAEGDAARKAIAEAHDKARREREAELRKQIGEATDPAELDRLRAELDAMRAKAKDERSANMPKFNPENAAGGLNDAIANMKAEAAGTFNKSNIQMVLGAMPNRLETLAEKQVTLAQQQLDFWKNKLTGTREARYA